MPPKAPKKGVTKGEKKAGKAKAKAAGGKRKKSLAALEALAAPALRPQYRSAISRIVESASRAPRFTSTEVSSQDL
jgi:hypothetical protein